MWNARRVDAIRERLNKVLPAIVIPTSFDHRLSQTGYFAQIALDTARTHGMRAPKTAHTMQNTVYRIVSDSGKGAEDWSLDVIEVTLRRFESGEFSNGATATPMPSKGQPKIRPVKSRKDRSPIGEGEMKVITAPYEKGRETFAGAYNRATVIQDEWADGTGELQRKQELEARRLQEYQAACKIVDLLDGFNWQARDRIQRLVGVYTDAIVNPAGDTSYA